MEAEKLQQDLQDNLLTQIGIEFYINSDSMDMKTVTKVMGIAPTETSEDISAPKDIGFSYWRYNSEYVNSNDVDTILGLFLNEIKCNRNKITKYLSKLDRVDMGICVVLRAGDEPFKISISRENIEILSKLNCILQFDVI